jgi:hypothetical protein
MAHPAYLGKTDLQKTINKNLKEKKPIKWRGIPEIEA